MPKAVESTFSFEDLRVWQTAMDLVDAVYELTDSWPRREMFGLTNQVRRAAVSIPSNIAEGQGRRSDPDFARFLTISLGSLMEVRTQLMIGARRGFSTPAEIAKPKELADEVGKMISPLHRTLKGKGRQLANS
jgi:four helix bundle protein